MCGGGKGKGARGGGSRTAQEQHLELPLRWGSGPPTTCTRGASTPRAQGGPRVPARSAPKRPAHHQAPPRIGPPTTRPRPHPIRCRRRPWRMRTNPDCPPPPTNRHPSWRPRRQRVTVITAGMLTGKELTEKADGIVPGKDHPHHHRLLSPPQSVTTGNASGVPSRGISTCREICSDPAISRYLPCPVPGPHLAVFCGFKSNVEIVTRLPECFPKRAERREGTRASLVLRPSTQWRSREPGGEWASLPASDAGPEGPRGDGVRAPGGPRGTVSGGPRGGGSARVPGGPRGEYPRLRGTEGDRVWEGPTVSGR